MKYLLKEHTRAVISAISVILLIGILGAVAVNGNTGFNNILGSLAGVNNEGYLQLEDAVKTTEILSGEPPTIQYDDSAVKIKCGTETEILKYFTVSIDGNVYIAENIDTIKILEITDSLGNSITYDSLNKTVIFENPGLYNVKLSVTDLEKRQTVACFIIPVEA